jgi:hypothetical protein
LPLTVAETPFVGVTVSTTTVYVVLVECTPLVTMSCSIVLVDEVTYGVVGGGCTVVGVDVVDAALVAVFVPLDCRFASE